MSIIDYKLIQGDGTQELAAEVMRFVKDGYEPHEGIQSAVVRPKGRDPRPVILQAIVKREPISAELTRLRDIERHVDQIVTELDNPCTDELGMLTFAHEELTKALRGGKWERE
jgi:hypothetical protein